MIEVEIPSEFLCPLTLDVMQDPVMTKYGHSYERSALLRWLKAGHGMCPMSRRPLNLTDIVSNHALRFRISHWQQQNGQEDAILVKPARRTDDMVYGYITLPDKQFGDQDDTEQTMDDIMEEDIAMITSAVARELTRQEERRAERRRQRRRSSSRSQPQQQQPNRHRRRPLQALRTMFSIRISP